MSLSLVRYTWLVVGIVWVWPLQSQSASRYVKEMLKCRIENGRMAGPIECCPPQSIMNRCGKYHCCSSYLNCDYECMSRNGTCVKQSCCKGNVDSNAKCGMNEGTVCCLSNAQCDEELFPNVLEIMTPINTDSDNEYQEKERERYKALVFSDYAQLLRLSDNIRKVSLETGIDGAILAGFISKMSRAGKRLYVRGFGPQEKYGVMQVDSHKYTPNGSPYSYLNIKQGAQILRNNHDQVKKKFPIWDKIKAFKAAIGLYSIGDIQRLTSYNTINSSIGGVKSYVDDVIQRAQIFKHIDFPKGVKVAYSPKSANGASPVALVMSEIKANAVAVSPATTPTVAAPTYTRRKPVGGKGKDRNIVILNNIVTSPPSYKVATPSASITYGVVADMEKDEVYKAPYNLYPSAGPSYYNLTALYNTFTLAHLKNKGERVFNYTRSVINDYLERVISKVSRRINIKRLRHKLNNGLYTAYQNTPFQNTSQTYVAIIFEFGRYQQMAVIIFGVPDKANNKPFVVMAPYLAVLRDKEKQDITAFFNKHSIDKSNVMVIDLTINNTLGHINDLIAPLFNKLFRPVNMNNATSNITVTTQAISQVTTGSSIGNSTSSQIANTSAIIDVTTSGSVDNVTSAQNGSVSVSTSLVENSTAVTQQPTVIGNETSSNISSASVSVTTPVFVGNVTVAINETVSEGVSVTTQTSLVNTSISSNETIVTPAINVNVSEIVTIQELSTSGTINVTSTLMPIVTVNTTDNAIVNVSEQVVINGTLTTTLTALNVSSSLDSLGTTLPSTSQDSSATVSAGSANTTVIETGPQPNVTQSVGASDTTLSIIQTPSSLVSLAENTTIVVITSTLPNNVSQQIVTNESLTTIIPMSNVSVSLMENANSSEASTPTSQETSSQTASSSTPVNISATVNASISVTENVSVSESVGTASPLQTTLVNTDTTIPLEVPTTVSSVPLINASAAVNASIAVSENVSVSQSIGTTLAPQSTLLIEANTSLPLEVSTSISSVPTINASATANASISVSQNVSVSESVGTASPLQSTLVNTDTTIPLEVPTTVSSVTLINASAAINASIAISENVSVSQSIGTTLAPQSTLLIEANTSLPLEISTSISSVPTLNASATVNASISVSQNVSVSESVGTASPLQSTLENIVNTSIPLESSTSVPPIPLVNASAAANASISVSENSSLSQSIGTTLPPQTTLLNIVNVTIPLEVSSEVSPIPTLSVSVTANATITLLENVTVSQPIAITIPSQGTLTNGVITTALVEVPTSLSSIPLINASESANVSISVTENVSVSQSTDITIPPELTISTVLPSISIVNVSAPSQVIELSTTNISQHIISNETSIVSPAPNIIPPSEAPPLPYIVGDFGTIKANSANVTQASIVINATESLIQTVAEVIDASTISDLSTLVTSPPSPTIATSIQSSEATIMAQPQVSITNPSPVDTSDTSVIVNSTDLPLIVSTNASATLVDVITPIGSLATNTSQTVVIIDQTIITIPPAILVSQASVDTLIPPVSSVTTPSSSLIPSTNPPVPSVTETFITIPSAVVVSQASIDTIIPPVSSVTTLPIPSASEIIITAPAVVVSQASVDTIIPPVSSVITPSSSLITNPPIPYVYEPIITIPPAVVVSQTSNETIIPPVSSVTTPSSSLIPPTNPPTPYVSDITSLISNNITVIAVEPLPTPTPLSPVNNGTISDSSPVESVSISVTLPLIEVSAVLESSTTGILSTPSSEGGIISTAGAITSSHEVVTEVSNKSIILVNLLSPTSIDVTNPIEPVVVTKATATKVVLYDTLPPSPGVSTGLPSEITSNLITAMPMVKNEISSSTPDQVIVVSKVPVIGEALNISASPLPEVQTIPLSQVSVEIPSVAPTVVSAIIPDTTQKSIAVNLNTNSPVISTPAPIILFEANISTTDSTVASLAPVTVLVSSVVESINSSFTFPSLSDSSSSVTTGAIGIDQKSTPSPVPVSDTPIQPLLTQSTVPNLSIVQASLTPAITPYLEIQQTTEKPIGTGETIPSVVITDKTVKLVSTSNVDSSQPTTPTTISTDNGSVGITDHSSSQTSDRVTITNLGTDTVSVPSSSTNPAIVTDKIVIEQSSVSDAEITKPLPTTASTNELTVNTDQTTSQHTFTSAVETLGTDIVYIDSSTEEPTNVDMLESGGHDGKLTFADIYELAFTVKGSGASDKTVKRFGLNVTGVEASEYLVEQDFLSLKSLAKVIKSVSMISHIPPELLGALISQRSRVGVLLNASYIGDLGFGLFQLAIPSKYPKFSPYSYFHIKYGAVTLHNYIVMIKHLYPVFNPQQTLFAALVAFELQTLGVPSREQIDDLSLNGDLTMDVIARAQWLRRMGYPDRYINDGMVYPTFSFTPVSPCPTTGPVNGITEPAPQPQDTPVDVAPSQAGTVQDSTLGTTLAETSGSPDVAPFLIVSSLSPKVDESAPPVITRNSAGSGTKSNLDLSDTTTVAGGIGSEAPLSTVISFGHGSGETVFTKDHMIMYVNVDNPFAVKPDGNSIQGSTASVPTKTTPDSSNGQAPTSPNSNSDNSGPIDNGTTGQSSDATLGDNSSPTTNQPDTTLIPAYDVDASLNGPAEDLNVLGEGAQSAIKHIHQRIKGAKGDRVYDRFEFNESTILNDIDPHGFPHLSQKGLGARENTYISNTLIREDYVLLGKHKRKIAKSTKGTGIDPALIAGLISKGSRAGRDIDRSGYGLKYKNYGLMQINPKIYGIRGGPYSEEHIKQGVGIVKRYLKMVLNTNPFNMSKEDIIKATVALWEENQRYYKGKRSIKISHLLNSAKIKRYTNDVLARTLYLKRHNFFQED